MSDIFKKNIKEWVSLDNELRILNEHVKELRDKRNSINEDIIRYVETNQLNTSTIQLSDGSLKFAMQKIYAPLTYTFLQETLKNILPENEVKKIIEYIKQNRNTTPSTAIKRSID